MNSSGRYFQSAARISLTFLSIEFFDEMLYGAQNAALPSIRFDLQLEYNQIGILLGLSGIVGTLLEPFLLILGDTRWRNSIMVIGGLILSSSLFIFAGSKSFEVALVALILAFPASGAFVSLSLASLMDINVGRQAQMMTRWSISGSLGNLIGPLFLAMLFGLHYSWRLAFGIFAVIGVVLTVLVWLINKKSKEGDTHVTLKKNHLKAKELLPNLLLTITTPKVMRWFGLLEMSDLMLDIYFIYLGLYLSDVIGLNNALVALILGGLILTGLVADIFLLPLLERMSGLKIVRYSSAAACLVFPAMLLVPWIGLKIVLALAVRFTTLGWYPVLQAQTYACLPGRSGTVATINSIMGIISNTLTWCIGWVASIFGLSTAMWFLIAGPLTLLFFIPGDEGEIIQTN